MYDFIVHLAWHEPYKWTCLTIFSIEDLLRPYIWFGLSQQITIIFSFSWCIRIQNIKFKPMTGIYLTKLSTTILPLNDIKRIWDTYFPHGKLEKSASRPNLLTNNQTYRMEYQGDLQKICVKAHGVFSNGQWWETKIWRRRCHELETSGSEPHIQISTSDSWSPAPSTSCKQRKHHNGTAAQKGKQIFHC